MTIHSDWARLLHEECPEAFLSNIPKDVDYGVGIIDGHLQLMCLNSGLGSWDRFVQYLFVNPIQKLFAAGCPKVVLCFDSYDSVPAYKSMTQVKRATVHNICNFGPDDRLPNFIPDDTMVFLMNRNFKLKVIDMVCKRLPHLIEIGSKQSLIVDYKRVVEYRMGQVTPVLLDEKEGLVPIGESDVKFTRYVDLYGNALVHAIDGDYLMIALLYYAMRGLRHKIFIFRQLSVLGGGGAQLQPPASGKPKPKASTDKKKKREDRPENQSTVTTKTTKTPKCWVDMQLIFYTIAQSMLGCTKRRLQRQPAEEENNAKKAVHAAVMLMLCAGTDFSRPLPLLGPKRIWEWLPDVGESLLNAAPQGRPVNIPLFANNVVGILYSNLFSKHVSVHAAEGHSAGLGPSTQIIAFLHSILSQIRKARGLSPSTKGRLPSEERVLVTLKNIAWVMEYWTVINGAVATPLDGSNGFVRHKAGGITFEDLALLDTSA